MRSIWKNGGFPTNQRGRVCVFHKKSQNKESINAFLFWTLILGDALKKHEAEPLARFPACGGAT